MSLISENSPVTALQEYDLFGLPPVQTTVETTYVTEYRPLGALNTGAHPEFNIECSENEYFIPRDTLLYSKFRIILTKSDKTNIVQTDWSSVSFINNLLNSMWQRIEVSIGDTVITPPLQTHAFKSYFENLVGLSEDAKMSFLSAAGWCNDDLPDTPHAPVLTRSKMIEHVTPNGVSAANDKEIDVGKNVELLGLPSFDLAFQGRAIIGGVKIKFKLIPHDVSFFLMCNDNKIVPRIEFLDIALRVKKQKVSKDIVIAHNKALNYSPARYPYCRLDVRTTTITNGTRSKILQNVMSGPLPRRCFICFISNEAFDGSLKKNPFHFSHYDVDYLVCFLNENQYPRRAYQPDFENGFFLTEYLEFYRAANQMLTDPHMVMSKSKYLKGSTFFGFNFSPDESDGCGSHGYISPSFRGSMSIQISFKNPLPETITVLIFSEFDSLLLIPNHRNALIDGM